VISHHVGTLLAADGREVPQGGLGATASCQVSTQDRPEESSYSIGQEVCFLGGRILFFTDRRGNVIENKGRVWKALGLSGNVYENKGDASIRRECYVRPNGADRQWVEVPPR
jgi:hypothetical protein